MIEQRQRGYTRRASQVDELEESRRRHDDFRTSMFSTSTKAVEAPVSAPRGGFSGSGHVVGGSGDSGASALRYDAAIRAAMAKDAQRGANGFNRINLTTSISTGSSAFQNQNGGTNNSGHSMSGRDSSQQSQSRPPPKAQHSMVPPAGAPSLQPGTTTERLSRDRDREREMNKKHYTSGSGGGTTDLSGSGDSAANGNVFAFSRDERPDNRGGLIGTVPGGGMNGSGAGVERGIGSSGAERQRSMWERGGGVDTARAVSRSYGTPNISEPSASGGGSGTTARHGGGSSGGSGTGTRVHSGDTDSHSSSSGGYVQGDGMQNPAKPLPWPQSRDVSRVGVDEGDEMGGHGGMALTPTGDDEPLELPDGCQHISLSKFLEVMTGPGLRVRKHHRAGKGSSGLRVLRYSVDEDSLVWDSHKILGAAQHVLPLSDVEEISMKPGNKVVLTCVGGKDSYAVFEAAKDDAAAVLYVGLERLRERTQSQS